MGSLFLRCRSCTIAAKPPIIGAMKLWFRCVLAGVPYTVYKVARNSPRLTLAEHEENYAVIDFDRQHIYVDQTVPEDIARKKLFHEVIHGLNERMSHYYVEMAENQLYPALTDPRNEDLFRALFTTEHL